jgi:hypothetical protein
LFDGYKSYGTIEELTVRLPERSTWQVLNDSKAAVRPSCPRFDEFRFAVPAEHLSQKGRLELAFFNDRLFSTAFTPENISAYAEALRQSGVVFKDGYASLPPATHVWQGALNGTPVVIGWKDERIERQSQAWVDRCS